jgi:hypothetical protein
MPEALGQASGTLRPEACWRLGHQLWQPEQVVRRATEDKQPVHLLNPLQFDLAQPAGFLQPSKALLHQPSPAQADGTAGLASRSAIQITLASFIVPGHVRRHIQLPRRAHKILGVVGLVGAHGNAARAVLLLLLTHQQRGIALGISIGVCHHGGGELLPSD